MSRITQNFEPKMLPLPHQAEAIQYLLDNDNAALFDEQGLGKTKIVIDALSLAMKKSLIDGVLVIAPLSLVFNWEQEINKHSHLIPIVLRGTRHEKRYKILTGANFYIVNYEAVVSEIDRITRFCRSRDFAIVLDEAARIKDPDTQTAKALFSIAPFARKRVILTGTPVANKPFDVWGQFYFLDNGKLLGDNFEKFKSEYDEKSSNYPIKLDGLKEKIAKNSIRRIKSDVLELPDKVYENVYVELGGEQFAMYEKLREELQIEIKDINGATIIDEADNILKKLLRLTQLASNPALVDSSYKEDPVKFPVLRTLIGKIVSSGDKVIIWSCFVENIIQLKVMFKEYGSLTIYGETPIPERARTVEKFQSDDRNMVLIANPSAAREGLTLTRANHAIYLDRNFNLVDYLQSQDRIHRISQTKQCVIYKLIARNTVDEYIDRIIEMKADIAKFVQGDTPVISNSSIYTLSNKQELLQLLGG